MTTVASPSLLTKKRALSQSSNSLPSSWLGIKLARASNEEQGRAVGPYSVAAHGHEPWEKFRLARLPDDLNDGLKNLQALKKRYGHR